MPSLLTNDLAISAISSLSANQIAIAATQQQIATGLRVSSPQDNAASWSIATNMRAQVFVLDAIQDTLNLTNSIAAVTYAVVTQIISLTENLQQDVVSAMTTGVDLNSIQKDTAMKQKEIISIANSATFNGQNWLVANKMADININETNNLNNTFRNIDQMALDHKGTPLINLTSNPPVFDGGIVPPFRCRTHIIKFQTMSHTLRPPLKKILLVTMKVKILLITGQMPTAHMSRRGGMAIRVAEVGH